MELGKKIAKVAVTGALLLSAMLPALAQNYSATRHRDPYTGDIVVRRTYTGPGERIVTTRRHHYRYYHRRHETTLYMTPYSTHRYHYDNDGQRYYYDSDGTRHYR